MSTFSTWGYSYWIDSPKTVIGLFCCKVSVIKQGLFWTEWYYKLVKGHSTGTDWLILLHWLHRNKVRQLSSCGSSSRLHSAPGAFSCWGNIVISLSIHTMNNAPGMEMCFHLLNVLTQAGQKTLDKFYQTTMHFLPYASALALYATEPTQWFHSFELESSFFSRSDVVCVDAGLSSLPSALGVSVSLWAALCVVRT